MRRTFSKLVCIGAAFSFGIVTTAAADSDIGSSGIALYFARHDAAAIAALASSNTTASLPSTLALADLYFMNGRMPEARRILLEVLRDHQIDDVAIWLAWMELAAHRPRDAERILADIVATGNDSASARAGLSLGWQRLLRGDYRAAADAFERVATDPAIPALGEEAGLLRGEALLFAHDDAGARDVLERVTATSLVADAARDLAWLRYRHGDALGARAELDALGAREDTGGAGVGVAWPLVLTHGVHALSRRWQRAYRERPRGQDPTVFLLAVGDRNASADARDMLRTFFPDATIGDPSDAGQHRVDDLPAARAIETSRSPRTAAADLGIEPRTPVGRHVGRASTFAGALILLTALAALASRRRRRTSSR